MALNSLFNLFNSEISNTFLSELCALEIIIKRRTTIKKIILQFLKEDSLIKKPPLKTSYMFFFTLDIMFLI